MAVLMDNGVSASESSHQPVQPPASIAILRVRGRLGQDATTRDGGLPRVISQRCYNPGILSDVLPSLSRRMLVSFLLLVGSLSSALNTFLICRFLDFCTSEYSYPPLHPISSSPVLPLTDGLALLS